MSKRVQRHLNELKVLSKLKPKQTKLLIRHANNDLVKCVCECMQNVANGVVHISPATKMKLSKHRNKIRKIINKRTKIAKKKKLLEQSGGFLPLLLAPIVGLLGSVVGEAISNAVRNG